jgi:hypothetical protein
MIADEEMRLELIVERTVCNIQQADPNKPIPIEQMRQMCRGALTIFQTRVPPDAELDELILELAEWHHVPVQAAP